MRTFYDPALGPRLHDKRLAYPFRNPELGALSDLASSIEAAMAAAGKWKIYETSKGYLNDGTFDLDDNTNWKLGLYLSTSNANTLSIAPILATLTNEHANANGYTTGGLAITPTWTGSSGTWTFDSTDPVWTASGGSIVARFGVIYKNATVNSIVKPLLAVCLLDTAPADVTATSGNTFTITMSVSGIFASSGANVD